MNVRHFAKSQGHGTEIGGRRLGAAIPVSAVALVVAVLFLPACAQVGVVGYRLTAGQQLSAGQSLYASRTTLTMQADGNLVIRRPNGQVVWNSRTYGNRGSVAVMQADGNLVVYSATHRALWWSHTEHRGATAVIQRDGNFVIYGSNQRAVWATGTAAPMDLMVGGQRLAGDQALVSSGGALLVMQTDGNLVLYGTNDRAIWASGTAGNPGSGAMLQTDGNLVVYNAANRALWSTRSYGHPGSVAVLTDRGLSVYGPDLSALWTNGGGLVVSGGGGGGPCSSTPGSGDNVTRWTPVVDCVLGMLRLSSPGDTAHVLALIHNESGGNPNAINLWDSNATVLHDPSRGLIQTIGSTFQTYRSPSLANDIYDPAANIFAGLNYGAHAYGSIARIPLGGY